MKNVTLSLLVAFGAAPFALASDLDLSVDSAGANLVQVFPGDSVNFSVRGELTDAQNQGLAMFAFDLAFDGGTLAQVAPGPSMGPFVAPQGLNNPAGFGGTSDGMALLQIGGAQNTIVNSFAPQPNGMVQTGIAVPGQEAVLATGSLTAPTQPGTYTLTLTNAFANAIDPATTGNPFWEVNPCGVGSVGSLTVEVLDCEPQLACTGLVNSLGCAPSMTWTGQASFTGASTLNLEATNLTNEQFGIWMWSVNPGPIIRYGTTLCIDAPAQVQLLPTTSGGGGTPLTTCDGAFQFQFDGALLQAGGYMPGTTVYTQCMYRDPLAIGTPVGVTPSVSFVVCP